MKKILFILGTRPEAIKLAPLIKELKKNPKNYEVIVGITAQHREMLDQVLNFFEIKPDYDLNLMKSGQTLFDITTIGLHGLEKIINDSQPDLIIVQGDTTTAFIGALAAYYNKIKVAHIEAGLRSGNNYSPFPEEINRQLVSKLSDFHFASTPTAKNNLSHEGIKTNVWMVGNTVIDALHLGLKIIKKNETNFAADFPTLNFSKRIILITGHRRENFGKPLKNICEAIKSIAKNFPKIDLVYLVHPNPNVLNTVNELLKNIKNIHLLPSLDYPHIIWLMEKSYLIITDSGGIQEEAPTLGKPILVTRNVTERMEGVNAGTAKLVGDNIQKITNSVKILLNNKTTYTKMSQAINPYGNGKTSQKIVKILKTLTF
jgi:UDP-N-acetylglucosamine 2-epimerase (non-hydrolysing)